MERERFFEHRRRRTSADGPGGDSLEAQRAELDGLLQASDHVFDSIDSVQAHQYLDQNLQTGAQ